MFIDEGIIPMDFDWRSSMQTVNHSYGNNITLDDIFNKPDIIKQQEKSRVKQEELNYRRNANAIIEQCTNGINNLIIGNSKHGITQTDIIILENSITNRLYEILNRNCTLIDNNIILEQIRYATNMYYNEFCQNCIRNNIADTDNMLAYNSDTGTILFNPRYMVSIIESWVFSNQSHIRQNDIFINE